MELAANVWAKQIHEIKIRELRELIAHKQDVLNNIPMSDDIHVTTRRHELILEICKLNDKLDFLIYYAISKSTYKNN